MRKLRHRFRNSDLRLSERRWEQLAEGYDAGFWAHVKDSAHITQ